MSLPKSHMLKAYRLATLPCRRWLHKRLQRLGQVPVTGLFLHRVADDYPNDWSISIETFDEILDWLQANVDLVSIDEAQRRIRDGNHDRLAVNISFDDGYADNCLHAIPTLLARRIPFTYYVTTHHVAHGKPFPHDLKLGQPLSPNSVEEIRAMAEAGVEIGVHTRTHPDLGQVRIQRDLNYELLGAREDLTNWIGSRPRHFAFPFGLPHNMTPRAIQFLHDEGFESYASAHGGYKFPTSSGFHLRRFNADPNLERVKNWLSLDPRWVYERPQYEYEPIHRTPAFRPIPSPTTSDQGNA